MTTETPQPITPRPNVDRAFVVFVVLLCGAGVAAILVGLVITRGPDTSSYSYLNGRHFGERAHRDITFNDPNTCYETDQIPDNVNRDDWFAGCESAFSDADK